MGSHRTPEELVQIYTLAQEGLVPVEIAEKTGVPYDSIIGALANLKRYLSGKARDQAKQSRNYKEATKLIRRNQRLEHQHGTPEPPEAIPEPHTTSHVASLKVAFDQFQQAMADFIEGEIGTRYRKLQHENRHLRDELEQVKKKAEEPQSINWIDSLLSSSPKEET